MNRKLRVLPSTLVSGAIALVVLFATTAFASTQGSFERTLQVSGPVELSAKLYAVETRTRPGVELKLHPDFFSSRIAFEVIANSRPVKPVGAQPFLQILHRFHHLSFDEGSAEFEFGGSQQLVSVWRICDSIDVHASDEIA